MIKRSIIIAALLLATTSWYANAQILFGGKISGGLAYQKIVDPAKISASSIKTFNIKGIVQLSIKNNFWLESGIGVAGKGSVVYKDALTTTTHLTYIEVPLSLLRKLTFTDLGIFYAGGGGYIALGNSGELTYQTPGSSTSDFVRFGKNNDFKKFDTGINFLTGFEFKNKLTFNMAYSLGLNNIASAPQQDSGITVVKNREFSIGLGYLF
jgi:hypothetical protein